MLRYVEPLSEARTKLAAFFSIPPKSFKCTRPYDDPQTSDSRREFLLLPDNLLVANPLASCQEGPGSRSL
jgi:hypothetical protein